MIDFRCRGPTAGDLCFTQCQSYKHPHKRSFLNLLHFGKKHDQHQGNEHMSSEDMLKDDLLVEEQ